MGWRAGRLVSESLLVETGHPSADGEVDLRDPGARLERRDLAQEPAPERELTLAGIRPVHQHEPDLGVDPARLVSMATAYGRRLGCYVVNDPERMQQLAALGLWGFVTDVPDVAAATLRSG
jgi:glycerophosphoryl diester phosphodiesterase